MRLQLLELLQNSNFVKKFLREAKNVFFYLFFGGCHHTLVVCGLQIRLMLVRLSLLFLHGTLRTVTTHPCNFHPQSPLLLSEVKTTFSYKIPGNLWSSQHQGKGKEQEDGSNRVPLPWWNKAVELNKANQGDLVKVHVIAGAECPPPPTKKSWAKNQKQLGKSVKIKEKNRDKIKSNLVKRRKKWEVKEKKIRKCKNWGSFTSPLPADR